MADLEVVLEAVSEAQAEAEAVLRYRSLSSKTRIMETEPTNSGK